MSLRLTGATAIRVLTQIRRVKRTVALIVFVPLVLLTLLKWMFLDVPVMPGREAPFNSVGPGIMGLFPLFIMFLITSVTTLRERQGGTMERLMASPVGRADVVFGYAGAFGLVAILQGTLVVVYSIWVLGLDFAGPVWALLLIIVLDAILGTALGLAASSLARTEFQALQMFPAVIVPQLLLSGIAIERDQMPQFLEWISDALPLSYAIDAIHYLTENQGASGIWSQVAILFAFIVGALILGVATLRRRTD
ncbi:MAG: ABC transporter permease [Demequinaceae bacterium]|nr:ABC transporter permease [Demequinaceae bacterium]